MNRFYNLKTGTKILFSCLIFLLVISVIAGNGIFSIIDRQKAFEKLYNENLMSVLHMNRFINNLLQIRINILTQEIALKRNEIAEFNKIRVSTNDIFQYSERILKSISSANSESVKKLSDELFALHNQLKNSTEEFELALRDKKHKETDKLNIRWTRDYIDTKNNAEAFLNIQQRAAEDLIDKQKITYSRSIAIELGLLVFAIIMSAFITLILKNSIVNPISKVSAFADKIAAGDLSSRITLSRKDELGLLANALNKSAENLGILMDNVLTAAQSLSQAVNQIAGGNRDLSMRTSEQTSAVEEIAAVMEETAIKVKQNAASAERAEKLAKITSQMSEDGTRIAGEATDSINKINESSKRIGEIISLINDISFQTNLLALNAAVEAARAGEQGRGFSAVAGEVRNLAQKSAKAAKDIDILIQNSIEQVENGTELVYKTGEALKKISRSNTDVTNIITEISAASREQKQGMDQINVVISEIDSMTQQNASLVEETASASEQMINKAKELLATVEKFQINTDSSSIDINVSAKAEATVNARANVKKINIAIKRTDTNFNFPVKTESKVATRVKPEVKDTAPAKAETRAELTEKQPLENPHKKKKYKIKKLFREKRKIEDKPDTELPPLNTNQRPDDISKVLSLEGFKEF